MEKPTLKKAAKRSVKGWGAVLTGGIVLTMLAMLDNGTGGTAGSAGTGTADGSTGCQLQVTSAELKVRSGPSIDTDLLQTLSQGVLVDGTKEVTDGFRRLEGDRWAANEFLVPVAGSAC